MRQLIQRALNRMLRPIGVEIRRIQGAMVEESVYERAVRELNDVYSNQIFPHLPPTVGRAELLLRLDGITVTHALYLVECLHSALKVAGDVCEFGVARGATSTLLANELRPTDRTLWLFDSFSGLSRPSAKDVLLDDVLNLGSMEAYEGAISFPAREVMARLSAIGISPSRFEIVEGYIDETISGPRRPARVCFAFVDFDFYEPIRAALQFLRDAMPPGGVILIHDYGYFSAGAQSAVDEFVAANRAFTLTLPPEYAKGIAVLHRV